ncbi:hypothetical protein C8Q78DRAFT_1191352 [Trametes maxima]|nr:hypothetical protein C8Q78DRAFT_1191352 [Trametes maxima]
MDLPAAFVLSRKQSKAFNPPAHSHISFHKDSKKESPHKSLPDNDLAERPQKDEDSDHNHQSSTENAKEKQGSSAKNKSNKSQEVNANSVPAPAPDTGVAIPIIHPGILPAIPSPTTLTVPAHSVTSGFSPLPSWTALVTSTALSGTLLPSGLSGDTSRALSDDQRGHGSQGRGSAHLSVVLIVLLSVGLSFLLLGAFVIWRACRRPPRRSCPTPSLPIFQDPFADQKTDEESLFGGKERASAVARPNSNGLWTWTQYTPKPSSQALGPSRGISNLPMPEPSKVVSFSEKPQPPLSPAPIHVPLPVSVPSPNPPMQQMQTALTRAANRVSALSMSIYPTSPQSASGIGLALGGMSPLTADGTPVLQRKPSANRLSKSRRSMRHSLAATEYLDMHADIYGGAQISTPFMPTTPQTPALPAPPPKSVLRKSTSISQGQGQGRARVKAPYNPGAGIRASSTVAGITTLAHGHGHRTSLMAPSDETQFVLPPLSPAPKSSARRERDTRALASALGLESPAPVHTPGAGAFPPVSPQPTLYPDDSITLAGDRRDTVKGSGRTGATAGGGARVHDPYRQSEAMSPGMEASARLGNLMLAEFTSMATLPSTRTVANVPASSTGAASRVARKSVRAEDRPPRVPSPPPLPSLAQMAMAHANPEEYADYRSPTYSIYGLYEAERKSQMPSEGGF